MFFRLNRILSDDHLPRVLPGGLSCRQQYPEERHQYKHARGDQDEREEEERQNQQCCGERNREQTPPPSGRENLKTYGLPVRHERDYAPPVARGE